MHTTAVHRRAVLASAALLLALAASPAPASTIRGGSSGEVLRGTSSADTIRGYGGADRLLGGAGNDRLYGGRGNDRLSGGAGADRLHGGSGTDAYACGTGRDTVYLDGKDVRGRHISSDCEVVRGLPPGYGAIAAVFRF